MEEMKKLNQYFDEDTKLRSSKTVNTYIGNMRLISKKLNIPILKEGVFDFDKLSNTRLLFENDWFKALKIDTQKNYMNGLIACLEIVDKDKYDKSLVLLREKRDTHKNDIVKQYKTSTPSQKQQDNWISMKDLQEVAIPYYEDKIKSLFGKKTKHINMDNQRNLNAYSVCLLYCGKYLPMRRLEYNSTTILNNKEYDKLSSKTDNYLVMGRTKGFFSINRYKTDHKYGGIKLELPNELFMIMKNILKASANNELLFPCLENVNECMKQDKLGLFITEVLKEATNKHLSVNILRNIYTTEMYKETHSLAEREELAKLMGTSVKTQMLCYNKCCKDEIKDDVESEVSDCSV